MAAQAKVRALKNGTALNGKWEIIEHIATGGKGEVYRHLQTNLDRKAVVKTISQYDGKGIEQLDFEAMKQQKKKQRSTDTVDLVVTC